MIELKRDGLEFWFPEVHKAARLRIEFQRTLRIPDGGGLMGNSGDQASIAPHPCSRRGGMRMQG